MRKIILVVLSLIAHGICKPVVSDDNEVGTGRTLEEELEAQMIRNSEVHAKRTFPHYDRDEDGFISMRDVKNFFSDLQNKYGLKKPGPSDTELNVLELMTDLNGDGRLDLEEFTKAWTPPIPGPLLKMRFETYDLDGDGFFDLEDYKKVLAVLGQKKSDRQFQFYDMNDDGKVTIVEYTTRESKCSHLMLLRMQYNIQRTGSPGLIFDTCEDS